MITQGNRLVRYSTFFHHVKRTRPADTVDIRNIEEVQVPWPFLGYEKADGLVARKLWPILFLGASPRSFRTARISAGHSGITSPP